MGLVMDSVKSLFGGGGVVTKLALSNGTASNFCPDDRRSKNTGRGTVPGPYALS